MGPPGSLTKAATEHIPFARSAIMAYRLVGLVVKASASRSEDPGF